MRSSRLAVVGLLGVLALSGCASGVVAQAAEVAPSAWSGHSTQVGATFIPNGETAITYDVLAVPSGGRVAVSSTSDDAGASVTFAVRGLVPERQYGAHVHVNACGPTGEAAGPHFQNVVDPVQPSVDPGYANPQNEIWLDFVTDENGAGSAIVQVPFGFTAERRPASIVVHAEHTHTAPGMAGTAGPRLACVNVDF